MPWFYNLLVSFFVINCLQRRPLFVYCLQPFLETRLDYAASPVDLGNLIKVESQLVLKFTNFIETSSLPIGTPNNLIYLKEYLEDFESTLLNDLDLNVTSFSRLFRRNLIDLQGFGEDAAKHPFKSYRTIRRLVKQVKMLQDIYENTAIFREIEEHQKLQQFPHDSDLTIASLSILRLNQLYKLPVSDFLVGKVGNLKTNCNLSPKHLLEIGKIALENDFYSQAVDFIATGLMNFVGPVDEAKEIEALLDEAVKKHDGKILSGVDEEDMQPDSGPLFFSDLLYNSSHENFKNRIPVPLEMLLQDIDLESVEGGSHLKIENLESAYNFQKLCNGEYKENIAHKSTLRCYLSRKSHPTYILRPLKVEVHHESPLLVQYHDVINEREIEELKTEVKGEMRMSRTIKSVKDELGQTSRYRTSSNAWITDYRHPRFNYLLERIGRMVGVNSTGLLSTENVQIAAYSPGGHYVPHTDAVFEDNIVDTLDASEFLRGDRIITFMIYLSDVEIGGATAFPLLKKAVQPVKGSAVVWYNLHSDGSIDRRMLHGGCSVVYGVKWIANKWIRIHDQMFKKRCPMSKSPWDLDI